MSVERAVITGCAALAACALVACGPNNGGRTEPALPVALGTQSHIAGPFANDPVAPAPSLAALPQGASNAALIRGRAPEPPTTTTAATGTNGAQPDPGDPLAVPQNGTQNGLAGATEPAPTPEEPSANAEPARDRLLDGLVGTWTNGERRSERGDNGYSVSECLLTIQSPTSAREVCTTTKRFGDNERDRCNEVAQTRRRVTASDYTLSVEGDNVRFTPGEPELVSDDEGRCQFLAAGRHTYMLSQGWTGAGSVLSIVNTAPGGTTGSPSVYRRRGRAR